jgi:hypothetical protein
LFERSRYNWTPTKIEFVPISRYYFYWIAADSNSIVKSMKDK